MPFDGLGWTESLQEAKPAPVWRNVLTKRDGTRFTGIGDHSTKAACVSVLRELPRPTREEVFILNCREGIALWEPGDVITQEQFGAVC